MKKTTLMIQLLLLSLMLPAQGNRVRDYGLTPGVMTPGQLNAITDVPGVKVGHVTLVKGDSVRTGVTAIVPHNGNLFRQKVPAAIYVGNGFGKLAGVTQVMELGTIETPVILTGTLSVPVASDALITYTLGLQGNERVRSVNPVVGETNDGFLNDIRGRHITEEDVLKAIHSATPGPVKEGNVGAGTGTVCFGFKGGIGTSSRMVPRELGGYMVGVLVQTNFGGVLQVDGFPAGEKLGQYYLSDQLNDPADGSCMIVVITDAPVDSRNLERMGRRAIMGLARTGGIASNGSGDYVIAMSVNDSNIERASSPGSTTEQTVLKNDAMSPLFLATIEATEEAILNSLFAADSMTGRDGNSVDALPVNRIIEMMGVKKR